MRRWGRGLGGLGTWRQSHVFVCAYTHVERVHCECVLLWVRQEATCSGHSDSEWRMVESGHHGLWGPSSDTGANALSRPCNLGSDFLGTAYCFRTLHAISTRSLFHVCRHVAHTLTGDPVIQRGSHVVGGGQVARTGSSQPGGVPLGALFVSWAFSFF